MSDQTIITTQHMAEFYATRLEAEMNTRNPGFRYSLVDADMLAAAIKFLRGLQGDLRGKGAAEADDSWLTCVGGGSWTLTVHSLSTSGDEKSIALFVHGKGSGSLQDYLNTLYRTSSDTPALRIPSNKASRRGRSPTR
jgi:hypothetical protein